MTKHTYLHRSLLLICLGSLSVFNSCKKDELHSKELLVYIRGDKMGVATNSLTVPFIHTPAGVVGNTTIRLAATATREVPADIDVSIEPEISRVAAFNEQNNTGYEPLPENAYRVVNPGKYRIPAGSVASDSMEIEITGAASLTNPAGYLLPLAISRIDGKDKGAQISTNTRVVYLTVTYAFNNIQGTEAPLTGGTLMSRTGWTVSVSNTTSGALGPAMVDGNNSTAWRSSNSSSAAKWVEVDMGAMKTIKGFQLIPNYVNRNENPTGIKVSTSEDDVTWTEQGEWTGTAPSTASSANDPDIKGINFIGPVQARYFRLDITARVSGNRVGIGELNVVQ